MDTINNIDLIVIAGYNPKYNLPIQFFRQKKYINCYRQWKTNLNLENAKKTMQPIDAQGVRLCQMVNESLRNVSNNWNEPKQRNQKPATLTRKDHEKKDTDVCTIVLPFSCSPKCCASPILSILTLASFLDSFRSLFPHCVMVRLPVGGFSQHIQMCVNCQQMKRSSERWLILTTFHETPC